MINQASLTKNAFPKRIINAQIPASKVSYFWNLCNDKYLETTLLISTDGFRKDYLSRSEFIPTINRLRECGSTAEFMEPSYPSKTFPNHYTLVTGLFPSQHGIVGNAWYDWKRDAQCSVFGVNYGPHPCNVNMGLCLREL